MYQVQDTIESLYIIARQLNLTRPTILFDGQNTGGYIVSCASLKEAETFLNVLQHDRTVANYTDKSATGINPRDPMEFTIKPAPGEMDRFMEAVQELQNNITPAIPLSKSPVASFTPNREQQENIIAAKLWEITRDLLESVKPGLSVGYFIENLSLPEVADFARNHLTLSIKEQDELSDASIDRFSKRNMRALATDALREDMWKIGDEISEKYKDRLIATRFDEMREEIFMNDYSPRWARVHTNGKYERTGLYIKAPAESLAPLIDLLQQHGLTIHQTDSNHNGEQKALMVLNLKGEDLATVDQKLQGALNELAFGKPATPVPNSISNAPTIPPASNVSGATATPVASQPQIRKK